MVRSLERSWKRYITNTPEGFIRAFKEDKITKTQLRGQLKKYANVDESIPIDDVIREAEKTIANIRKT